jgi:ribosomal protein S18 acetylase RimI-like enzyme
MPITYRPARTEDLPRANELVVASINDLCQRHGFGPMATLRPPAFAAFSLRDDPDGLWVAEETGQIAGFAFSWVRGDLWFLAQLFVSPDHQGRGIGQELVNLTLEHARKGNAGIHALITFSFNPVSQALYIRHGFFPRCQIYQLSAAREALLNRVHDTPLRCVPLQHTASHFEKLAAIDAQALGVSRAKHHRFLREDGATRGVLLYDGDNCAGYAYVCDGHIGPLAVTQRAALGPAFTTALNLAADSGSRHTSAFLPAPCETALRAAIEHGLRITNPMVLMSTRAFGDWAQYLPRNPGFM